MRRIAQVIAIGMLLTATTAWAQRSSVRVDVYGGGKEGALELKESSEGLKGGRCTWFKDEGQVSRSLTINSGKLGSEWKEFSFTIQTDTDMAVRLCVRGTYQKLESGDFAEPATWYDGFKVEGAEIKNGDFETAADGWKMSKYKDEPAKVIEDAGKAKEGKSFLQASCYRQANQTINVKAGEPVTVSLWARAAE